MTNVEMYNQVIRILDTITPRIFEQVPDGAEVIEDEHIVNLVDHVCGCLVPATLEGRLRRAPEGGRIENVRARVLEAAQDWSEERLREEVTRLVSDTHPNELQEYYFDDIATEEERKDQLA